MRFIWLIPIALIVGLDQLSKYFIVQKLDNYESIPIIDGILNFTRIPNDGMAFGLLDDNRLIFMIASALLILAVAAFMFVYYKKYYHPILYTALSFIVGGGIGNMIDRIFFVDVVDFIDVIFIPFWKWIFNVADMFVCVGAAMAIVYFVVSDISESKQKKLRDTESTADN